MTWQKKDDAYLSGHEPNGWKKMYVLCIERQQH